jgi:hypothetical protein
MWFRQNVAVDFFFFAGVEILLGLKLSRPLIIIGILMPIL